MKTTIRIITLILAVALSVALVMRQRARPGEAILYPEQVSQSLEIAKLKRDLALMGAELAKLNNEQLKRHITLQYALMDVARELQDRISKSDKYNFEWLRKLDKEQQRAAFKIGWDPVNGWFPAKYGIVGGSFFELGE